MKAEDIQGIPWESLNMTREDYRLKRLEEYKNYENIPLSGQAIDKEYKQMQKGESYYRFFRNTRLVKPTIPHFQLRNLVWATSKDDVYVLSNNKVVHWSSVSSDLSQVIDFNRHAAPVKNNRGGQLLESFVLAQTHIAAFSVKDNILVAGGFQGELIMKRLDEQGIIGCGRLTYDPDALTNSIEIYDNIRGGLHFMVTNNDGGIRQYDAEKFQIIKHFRYPWPVNHASVSPDRKLIAVVGDHLNGFLVNAQNGEAVAQIVGHKDYSCATAWHPDGTMFATGSQDKTCRVWDIRNVSLPVAVVKGNLGTARSIRFSSDGEFMVVAEPVDFVHVYSAKANYERRQEIDLLGEISGVALSPDNESLYIGVMDQTYGSLLHFNKIDKDFIEC